MTKITINDVRRAVSYVGETDVLNWSDEKLLKADFLHDLNMGNIRVANVSIEIQRTYNISLPPELFRQMPDNTVRSFIEAANFYLSAREQN